MQLQEGEVFNVGLEKYVYVGVMEGKHYVKYIRIDHDIGCPPLVYPPSDPLIAEGYVLKKLLESTNDC